MRRWLAVKLFNWAVRLNWDAVFIMSLDVVRIEAKWAGSTTSKIEGSEGNVR